MVLVGMVAFPAISRTINMGIFRNLYGNTPLVGLLISPLALPPFSVGGVHKTSILWNFQIEVSSTQKDRSA
jgi:hypothetical protein